jgi:hypothetical protein
LGFVAGKSIEISAISGGGRQLRKRFCRHREQPMTGLSVSSGLIWNNVVSVINTVHLCHPAIGTFIPLAEECLIFHIFVDRTALTSRHYQKYFG